jgi:hypothetical protein
MTNEEEKEVRQALAVAMQILEEVEAEANNIQLRIGRFRRRYHRALTVVGVTDDG